ncbi:hypothetical protein M8C21_027819 [Ambrosia artemisiifolia]|uniref:Uncharacterized protein n=1 Tax=Ambrosia artemisiifolia TaxID=4212 RepID=A0AAD5GJP5_AMBAR|nr:hypothetical protein M8C21_027819 [Ambrosia artemisiifolia]
MRCRSYSSLYPSLLLRGYNGGGGFLTVYLPSNMLFYLCFKVDRDGATVVQPIDFSLSEPLDCLNCDVLKVFSSECILQLGAISYEVVVGYDVSICDVDVDCDGANAVQPIDFPFCALAS